MASEVLGVMAPGKAPRAPHCTALRCTALHCTALHCTALCGAALHYAA
ncbi:MAG: hypothetical protein GY823_07970 [Flavobacteriaceae bacterium]|nr:hypothetical protein [Flavobacteriaceae bacterium]